MCHPQPNASRISLPGSALRGKCNLVKGKTSGCYCQGHHYLADGCLQMKMTCLFTVISGKTLLKNLSLFMPAGLLREKAMRWSCHPLAPGLRVKPPSSLKDPRISCTVLPELMFALDHESNFPWAGKACWQSSESMTKLWLDSVILIPAHDHLLGDCQNTFHKA